ncbi:hypothetical protein KSS87_004544 [Heliosperma pusillum]|nr:hypothetical protein KSS87_004544 [Heliosperma pusillum]
MEREGESVSGGGGGVDEDMLGVKELREQIEDRIQRRHCEHQQLMSCFQTQLPHLMPSLHLSLNLLSSFHRRPDYYFNNLPTPHANPNPNPIPVTNSSTNAALALALSLKKKKQHQQQQPQQQHPHQPNTNTNTNTNTITITNINNNTNHSSTDDDLMKDLEEILNRKSFKENLKSQAGEEIFNLLCRRTAKERAIADKFKTKDGPQIQHYCLSLTKEDCRLKSNSFLACHKVHFRRIIAPHTDINLGDCSFLDTCRHMKTCKYVHYELDPTPDVSPIMGMPPTLAPPKLLKTQRAEYCSEVELGESQWISCDIRNFRMDILGQFGVIMADPPWDIHMELPYGTMADDEMRTLNVPALQTDGLIFLWVTGRAMELGRECLELWGYKRVEEIIWVKTNQLQRIIRTGRTGHWLNHSKEHCLVGIKGSPLVNRNIDTDVIVAEVRETSRKPDEMYPLLERISPRTRKLELFARMHNTQSGWLSLGNQLNGVRLVDDGLRARFKAAYPDVEVQPTSPPRSSAMDIDPGVRTPFSGAETSSELPQVDVIPQGKPSSSQDVAMVC